MSGCALVEWLNSGFEMLRHGLIAWKGDDRPNAVYLGANVALNALVFYVYLLYGGLFALCTLLYLG